jgi:hypothetical protein
MTNKTVCYLIFGTGKGNGGHYRSLSVISNALKNKFNVLIFNIGYTHSQIIIDSGLENYFFKFNGINVFGTFKKMNYVLKNRNLYLVHCFDHQSMFLGKILTNFYKIPLLYTMCGGASPRSYFPYVKYVTVFSHENLKFFKGSEKFRNSMVWCIPNRVINFEVSDVKIKALTSKFQLYKTNVFLRICRISHYYKKSIIQAIDLINDLTDKNYNVCLLIIGNVQDADVYGELVKRVDCKRNIYFVTDDSFTLNAKELIDISNFVIGTGRGFMEACSRGKIMLVPCANSNYPVLIDSKNFEQSFNYNFSERTEFSVDVVINNLNNIVNLLNNQKDYIFESNNSKNRFNDYFSIAKGVHLYIDVYESLNYIKYSNIDLLFNWLFFIRNNLGNWFRGIITFFK